MKVILHDLDRPYDGIMEARCDEMIAADASDGSVRYSYIKNGENDCQNKQNRQ